MSAQKKYKVVLSDTFKKQYAKLPKQAKKAIDKAIAKIAKDPHTGVLLKGKATGKHPPTCCPKCGSKNLKYAEYYTHSPHSAKDRTKPHGTGYDTYCTDCEWSGHIEPDKDFD